MSEKNPYENCLQGMATLSAVMSKLVERTMQLNASSLQALFQQNQVLLSKLNSSESSEDMLRLPMDMANKYNQLFTQHLQQSIDNFSEVCREAENLVNTVSNNNANPFKAATDAMKSVQRKASTDAK